jgi:hypothetical protein
VAAGPLFRHRRSLARTDFEDVIGPIVARVNFGLRFACQNHRDPILRPTTGSMPQIWNLQRRRKLSVVESRSRDSITGTVVGLPTSDPKSGDLLSIVETPKPARPHGECDLGRRRTIGRIPTRSGPHNVTPGSGARARARSAKNRRWAICQRLTIQLRPKLTSRTGRS